MLTSSLSMAWSDHATLAWPLLRAMPEVAAAPPLEVETLQTFLTAQAQPVAQLLGEHEQWARTSMPHYAPLPDELTFTPSAEGEALERSFLEAIRVNPTRSYQPYRQMMAYEALSATDSIIDVSELTFLRGTIESNRSRYVKLGSGDTVPAASVVASASDEPDFGLDIGLYEDNGTEHGARYGFGVQPFGNPNLEYSSQAPFHMGFYHLDWLSQRAQPGLLVTYPMYRTELYRKLATLAFAGGHDYWGWRFMGWGLHYVGDLAQPYHAVPLPGIGLVESLWTVVTSQVGAAIQLVSNRHGVIEAFQMGVVTNAVQARHWEHPTLSQVAQLQATKPWTSSTLVDDLALSSVQGAPGLDGALERWVPPKLVSDATFEFSQSPEEADILSVIGSYHPDSGAELEKALNQQMGRFSYFAQAWIRSIIQTQGIEPG
ncbi:hypothetical protein CWI75_07425 [Kineobactrum sediminis]|uniref:Phospholipase n=2 Tax=Kineobactrum sediminis TaxID=1905677 RepID=A0A2N5Y4X2_9GAMM|nr:hypothetical protein CWI75_07425 [Kineobactrum sediminis]